MTHIPGNSALKDLTSLVIFFVCISRICIFENRWEKNCAQHSGGIPVFSDSPPNIFSATACPDCAEKKEDEVTALCRRNSSWTSSCFCYVVDLCWAARAGI
jgi:hypothetical protein